MTTPNSRCARNLPQHFNGCACTPGPGGATAEVTDVDLSPAPRSVQPTAVVKKSADYDADSPKYDVEIDGRKIGTVGRGWFHNGGTQWFNSVRGVLYPVGHTRQAAVNHLIRNAKDPETWTEKFPSDSAAANVAAFKGKPVDEWFWDGSQGDACFIAADGAYVSVTHDEEPTGHWFIDGAWADGSDFDGGCIDDRAAAKQSAEQTLRAGKAAYEREQEQWR